MRIIFLSINPNLFSSGSRIKFEIYFVRAYIVEFVEFVNHNKHEKKNN